eukprot:PITA_11266
MAEYEALLLGLKLVKSLQAIKVSILGDLDLVIQQVKGNFVTNDKRLRSYSSAATELLKSFTEFQIAKIPRAQNLHAHSLATFASTCKLPLEPHHCFTAEIKHRPSVPNNVKDLQVFDDDTQTNNFLTLQEEFSGLNIDTETAIQSQRLETASQSQILETTSQSKIQGKQNNQAISPKTANQILHPTIFNKHNIQEIQQIKCDCGGHLYWKSTVDKILRAGYYWPTIFSDIKKFSTSCHKCQVFEGKRKLLPLPLRPIATEIPFQQWGLDFIGEINPSSSGQHRWILTATYYFTKWIEAIPCR